MDWLSPAAPRIVVEQLAGSHLLYIAYADLVSDAYRERATRLAHGYFNNRGGVLHIQVDLEDLATHKMVAHLSADGDALTAVDRLARQLDSAPLPFSTASPTAVQSWAKGDYEAAVSADPGFATAWLDWAQSLMRQDPQRAHAMLADAVRKPELRSEIKRFELGAALAAMEGDSHTLSQSLTSLVSLRPADPGPLQRLADLEMKQRSFADAAKHFRSASQVDPADSSLLNLAGYADAFAGDLAAARTVLEAYGKYPGQALNSLDSLGEAYFINGQFVDAERSFLAAAQKDPAFLAGAPLLKAAYARWLAGDLPGADQIQKRYVQQRLQAHDPTIFWREAVWLWTTGRRDDALAFLERAPGHGGEIGAKQRAFWKQPFNPPSDLPSLQRAFENTPPSTDGLLRTFYAKALVGVGKKNEAKRLVEKWPLPDSAGDPVLQALLYPEFLKLRKELGQ